MRSRGKFSRKGSPRQLVVDRSEWMPARLPVPGLSWFYDPTNKRSCILGLLVRAAGMSKEEAELYGNPAHARFSKFIKDRPKLWDLLLKGPESIGMSKWAYQATIINDKVESYKVIEKELKTHFNTKGIKLTFEGELQ